MQANSTLNKYCWILAIAIETIALVYLVTTRNFSIDEFESIHSGWKILNGENIYEDFIQQKNPVLYYLLAIIVYLFGESVRSVIASSCLMLIFTTGILFYSYKLAVLLFDRETALFAVLLLPVIPWFALTGFEIRPDVPMLCFCMASLYYLYTFFQDKNRTKLILSAIQLMIAFLFIQKAVFWFVIVAGILINRLIRHEINIKSIVIYIATSFSVYCLFLVSLSLDISLSSYFFFTGEFVHARQTILGGPGNMDVFFNEISRLSRFAWLIIPAFIASFSLQNLTRMQWEVALSGIWLFLTVFLVTYPADRYFMPAMPLFAILIASAFVKIATRNNKAPVIALLVIGVLSYNFTFLAYDNNVPGTEEHDRERQLTRVEYVQSITSKDDFIYDGMNRFNLYRKDLDFVWLGGHKDIHLAQVLDTLIPYHYDIYDLILDKEPTVISHYYLDTTRYSWILRRYRRSELFNDVYIRIKNNTGYDFWYTFTDSIGSTVKPKTDIINSNGDIEVTMKKAPEYSKNGKEFYPYVGLVMKFYDPEIPVNLNGTDFIRLNYKLSGPMSLLLAQEGVRPGEEYMVKLEPVAEYTRITLRWNDFHQPGYITHGTELRLDKITGIKFQIKNETPDMAKLGIRNIEIPGLEQDDLYR